MSTTKDYIKIFEDAKKSYEEKGYTPIHKFLFDPSNSIFKSDKTRPAYVKIIYCNQCNNESIPLHYLQTGYCQRSLQLP